MVSIKEKHDHERNSKIYCRACVPTWFVYLCFGMRLLCVWLGQKEKGAPLDPCLQQNVLCSLNECVNYLVRGENT